jgi:transposase InsO family protein
VNEVWVGNITYIPLATRTSSSRFRDPALLMDLFSRRIVGWDFGLTIDEDPVHGKVGPLLVY